jgi:type IV pilus assembly protein PilW
MAHLTFDHSMPSMRTVLTPRQRGMTIIELMVAMVLGLILIGGVVSVFLNNRQAVASNEGLARVQESGRFAFELLMRDLRDAGHTPCGSPITANTLTSPKPWWGDTDSGLLRGWDDTEAATGMANFGTGASDRVASTDAVRVLRASWSDSERGVIIAHTPTTADIGLQALGSIGSSVPTSYVLVCDGQGAALTEIADRTTLTNVINYAHTAATRTCTSDLGTVNADCTASTAKTFSPGSQVAVWSPAFWYVGRTATGERGLYRRSKDDGWARREIVRGVTDMQIQYLLADMTTTPPTLSVDWVPASDAAISGKWADLTVGIAAIRIELTVQSPESVGSDGQPIQRKFYAVANYRSRDF